MVTILQMVVIVAVVVFIFMVALACGFWMGRHTLEKTVFIQRDKTGGQPKFEEDPWRDAQRDTKSEGSL